MSKKWEVYGCYIDGKYSVVRVDVGIDLGKLPESLPTLMRIRVVYKSHDSRGMPGKTDLKLLRQVVESLKQSSVSDGAICVGWLTSDGHRDHFLYGNEHALQVIWNQVSGEFQTIDMTSELAEEPDWRTYRELLYPNRIDWQVIWNRKIAARLQARGDNAHAERRIENFAWFSAEFEREAFIQDLQLLEVDLQFRRIEEDEQFGVEFSFISALDIGRIDALTTRFIRLASEKGGEYDGWGCPVTK